MIPFITGGGVELSANAQRVAEIVRDFDDTLELEWIPPLNRSPLNPHTPYRIIQRHPDYEPYVVMEIREDQLDHRIIAALFKARNFDLSDLEAEENAKRAMRMREKMDEQGEDAKFVKWAVNSTRTVQHNGRKYT